MKTSERSLQIPADNPFFCKRVSGYPNCTQTWRQNRGSLRWRVVSINKSEGLEKEEPLGRGKYFRFNCGFVMKSWSRHLYKCRLIALNYVLLLQEAWCHDAPSYRNHNTWIALVDRNSLHMCLLFFQRKLKKRRRRLGINPFYSMQRHSDNMWSLNSWTDGASMKVVGKLFVDLGMSSHSNSNCDRLVLRTVVVSRDGERYNKQP